MALIYLIRHGQAGTRDDYDRLSDLGRLQAGRLGEWIRSHGGTFDLILSGALKRQRETAAIALGWEPEADEGWNEFDLDRVYAEMAPRLAEADPGGFGLHYKELMNKMTDGGDEIHRQWTEADSAVVAAWVRDRFGPINGLESFAGFTNRVAAAFDGLERAGAEARVAVFTSATPTALCVGRTLGIAPERTLKLAGASFNANISVLRLRGGQSDLVTFNSVCHLMGDGLLTHR